MIEVAGKHFYFESAQQFITEGGLTEADYASNPVDLTAAGLVPPDALRYSVQVNVYRVGVRMGPPAYSDVSTVIRLPNQADDMKPFYANHVTAAFLGGHIVASDAWPGAIEYAGPVIWLPVINRRAMFYWLITGNTLDNGVNATWCLMGYEKP